MTEQATLLLTRPASQSADFLADLSARLGKPVPCVIAPLIEVIPAVSVSLPDAGEVVVTSSNALIGLGDLAGRGFHVVGPNTAVTVRQRGGQVLSEARDVRDLLDKLKQVKGRNLTYLRGEVVSFDLKGALVDAGISLDETIAYHQRSLPIRPEAEALLSRKGHVVIPVFSRLSGIPLVGLVEKCVATVHIMGISDAAVAAFAGLGCTSKVAKTPDRAGMLDLVSAAFTG